MHGRAIPSGCLRCGEDDGVEGVFFCGEVAGEFCRVEVLFEVVYGDFFVGGDAVSGIFPCCVVEVAASEEFFCVCCFEIDELPVEVGVVLPEFFYVYGVGGPGGPVDAVFPALAVFAADSQEVCVVLFKTGDTAFFKGVGKVAAVEGCFVGLFGARVDAGEGYGEEGFWIEGV